MDPVVRAEVVEDVAHKDVRDLRDRALRVSRVVVPRARVRLGPAHDVDLAVRVREAHEATRHDGDRVLLVVDADEVRDLGVEESRPRRVPDARRAVGDGLDVDARGEVEREEHGVELGERASQRVADLCGGDVMRNGEHICMMRSSTYGDDSGSSRRRQQLLDLGKNDRRSLGMLVGESAVDQNRRRHAWEERAIKVLLGDAEVRQV